VAFHRQLEGSGAAGPEPVRRSVGHEQRRRTHDSAQLATGTLACPVCDAPVLPGPGAVSVRETLACGFCSHSAALREFLTLGQPTRPTRVTVRVRRLARS